MSTLARVFVAAALAACPGHLAAQAGGDARTGPSAFHGRVVDHETGRPVADAAVTLGPRGAEGEAGGTRLTDADGAFRFEDVPAGDYVLTVASLRHRTAEDPVEVPPGSDVRLVVRLSAQPLPLEPLVVVTARRAAFMDGFDARRARARRHTAFFTGEEIREKYPRDLTDLFRETPGVDVVQNLAAGNRIRVAGSPTGGPPCEPNTFVNGRLVEFLGMPYSELYAPEEIAAIELYAFVHDTPQRFQGPRPCGALVIWLREPAPEDEGPPAWKRWVVGVGVMGTVMLLLR